MWKDRSDRQFLGLMSHFINYELTLRKIIPGVIEINGSCTSETIREFSDTLLTHIFPVYSLKNITYMTDNCPNMVKAYGYEENSCGQHNVQLAFIETLDILEKKKTPFSN